MQGKYIKCLRHINIELFLKNGTLISIQKSDDNIFNSK